MNSPFGWTLPVLAMAATAVALLSGSNGVIAIPAATASVAAAGLALWLALRRPGATRSLPGAPTISVAEGTGNGFEPEGMDTEAIVLSLDRIERALWHPDLPIRDMAELGHLRSLPENEFLDYVQRRLDELEAGT
jgi:hypothetical protein